jgi:hypothetical protein
MNLRDQKNPASYGLFLRRYVATQAHARNDIDHLARDVLVVYGALHNFADFRVMTAARGLWRIAPGESYHHFRHSSKRNEILMRSLAEVAWVAEVRLERAFRPMVRGLSRCCCNASRPP